MGLMGTLKGGVLKNAAMEAWNGGERYFTPLLKFPLAKADLYGVVKDWPGMIDAVESVGWELHTWSVTSDERGLPQALPLFRRP
jgi:hypothetical protein